MSRTEVAYRWGYVTCKKALIFRGYHEGMRHRAFVISLVLIGGLIVLSATPGIGAMVGLFFAFTVAFFVAPPAFGLQWLINRAGLSVDLKQLLYILLSLYGFCVLVGLYRAYNSFLAGDRNKARLIGAKAALFASLPLAAYLSSEALVKAWP